MSVSVVARGPSVLALEEPEPNEAAAPVRPALSIIEARIAAMLAELLVADETRREAALEKAHVEHRGGPR